MTEIMKSGRGARRPRQKAPLGVTLALCSVILIIMLGGCSSEPRANSDVLPPGHPDLSASSGPASTKEQMVIQPQALWKSDKWLPTSGWYHIALSTDDKYLLTSYPAAIGLQDGAAVWEGPPAPDGAEYTTTGWGIVQYRGVGRNYDEEYWIQRIWPERESRVTIPNSRGYDCSLSFSEPVVQVHSSNVFSKQPKFDVGGTKARLVRPSTDLPVVRPPDSWETALLSRNAGFAVFLERQMTAEAGVREKVRKPARLMVYDITSGKVAYTRDVNSIAGATESTPLRQATNDLNGVGTPSGKPIDIDDWTSVLLNGWNTATLVQPLSDGRVFVQGTGIVIGPDPSKDALLLAPENAIGFVLATSTNQDRVLALQAVSQTPFRGGIDMGVLGTPELFVDTVSGAVYSNPVLGAREVLFAKDARALAAYDEDAKTISVWQLSQ